MPTYEYHCTACGHRFEVMMTLREHESLPHAHAASGSARASKSEQEPQCPKCRSRKTVQDLSVFQAITSSKS